MLISSGSTQSTPTGDYSVALDNNNFVYIARTAALAVYQITRRHTEMQPEIDRDLQHRRHPALGRAQHEPELRLHGQRQGAGTISGYAINSTPGALARSPARRLAAPANVSAIGVDKSGKYMVAAGYNGSSGMQLFTIGTTGALTLVTSAGTGTSTAFPAILAMSH